MAADTYLDEDDVERCDGCEEMLFECCCECSECGDYVHECACDWIQGGPLPGRDADHSPYPS